MKYMLCGEETERKLLNSFLINIEAGVLSILNSIDFFLLFTV